MNDAKVWCFFSTDGGRLRGHYASREEAIAGAHEAHVIDCEGYDGDPEFQVGTRCDPNEILGISLDDVVEQIGSDLCDEYSFKDCGVTALPGAADALSKWVADYVRCDWTSACIDGAVPTTEEWEAARRAYDERSGGGEA
jgi:hypothetical protein